MIVVWGVLGAIATMFIVVTAIASIDHFWFKVSEWNKGFWAGYISMFVLMVIMILGNDCT